MHALSFFIASQIFLINTEIMHTQHESTTGMVYHVTKY